MKKLISLALTVLLVFGLCACNASTGDAQQEAAGFRVGFGSAVATPEENVYLMGYGNDKDRMSESVLTDILVTCVAITGENDNTVLMFGLDMMKIENALAVPYCKAISEATGVPVENITLSASHSHSTPALGSMYGLTTTYGQFYQEKLIEAAKAAMADRSGAEIKAGTKIVDRMNFVRHYNTASGEVVGDNFGAGGEISHTTESDKGMQLIHFVRGDKKDIVMVNWQAHPTLSSTNMVGAKDKYYLVSADYIYYCREYIEDELDCNVSFYLGASGNLNAYSRIKSENISTDYKKYGQNLGKQVVEGLADLKTYAAGDVKTQRTMFPVELLSGGESTVELSTYAMGELAWATVPYEMFDTNGMTVKSESPYEVTMMFSMTNYYLNYVPADNAFDYPNCYEVRSCRFVRGTGEAVANGLVDQLKALKG